MVEICNKSVIDKEIQATNILLTSDYLIGKYLVEFIVLH